MECILFSVRDIFGHNFTDFAFQDIEYMLKMVHFFWLVHISSKKLEAELEADTFYQVSCGY